MKLELDNKHVNVILTLISEVDPKNIFLRDVRENIVKQAQEQGQTKDTREEVKFIKKEEKV